MWGLPAANIDSYPMAFIPANWELAVALSGRRPR